MFFLFEVNALVDSMSRFQNHVPVLIVKGDITHYCVIWINNLSAGMRPIRIEKRGMPVTEKPHREVRRSVTQSLSYQPRCEYCVGLGAPQCEVLRENLYLTRYRFTCNGRSTGPLEVGISE